ncbi:hypothetical protein B7463_g3040, partial [Scytalidium lignicola]
MLQIGAGVGWLGGNALTGPPPMRRNRQVHVHQDEVGTCLRHVSADAGKVASAVCGIHSFTSCADGIVHWFDPLTGEICDPLDCGGGRAPPKTDVPGCPLYKGTATLATSASYLSCWTPTAAAASSTLATTISVAAPTTTSAVAIETSTTSSSTLSSIETSASIQTITSSTPSITQPATLSTQSTIAPGSGVISSVTASITPSAGLSSAAHPSTNGTLSTGASGAPPLATPNAGSFLDGSLVAVAGAAMGVMALVY